MTVTAQPLRGSDGFEFTAWSALPDGLARGAVVVLPEIFGVNAHIRAVCARFAARGYVAVAPDTFGRVEPGVDLDYGPKDMEQGMALKAAAEKLQGQVLADVAAAIAHAAALSGGRVGIVGFCWGGLLAWRAACELPGLAAAACYYGGGMTQGAEPQRQPRCPVIAHFGERDSYITVDSVRAFSQAHPEVQVHLYDADHGFNCDQRGSYDEAAALQARERTLAFFEHWVG